MCTCTCICHCSEQLTSEDDYHNCWVTVFGFPSTAASFILEQFSQYGTILKHVVSNATYMYKYGRI